MATPQQTMQTGLRAPSLARSEAAWQQNELTHKRWSQNVLDKQQANGPTSQRANAYTSQQPHNHSTIQPFNHSTNALPTANNHIRTHTATSDPNADCRRPAGHMEDGTAKHTTARLTNRTNRTHPTRPDRTGPTPTGPRPANAPAEIERNQQRTTTNNNDNNQSERTNEQTNKRTNERTNNECHSATARQRVWRCGGWPTQSDSTDALSTLTHSPTHSPTHSLTHSTHCCIASAHSLPPSLPFPSIF